MKAVSKVMTEKAEQIFVSALEMVAKKDRKVFLDRACQGDATVRAEVEDMLALQPQLEKIFPEGGVEFTLAEDLFDAARGLETSGNQPRL